MSNARFCIIPARALGDRRLNRTDIMVLNALGMFGDKEGWSFPSTRKIGELIGDAHRTSVSKALSKLAEHGYVEVRSRYHPNGGQTSNEYRILFDAPSVQGHLDLDMPAAPDYEESHPPVVESLHPRGESTTPPVAAGTTPPVVQPPHQIKEPTLTPHSTAAQEPAGDVSVPDFAKVYQRVLEILNSPIPFDGSPVHQWLAWGAIPEVDIYPTIERINGRREFPPNTLKFFNQAIADAIHERKKPMPEQKNHAKPSQNHGNGHRPSKSERAAAALRKSADDLGFGASPGQ